jgi:hypothetical protein
MLALIVTAALAAGPVERNADVCTTLECEQRVERKMWRRTVRPFRAWLEAIAWCESRNDPQASNGTHFGLYQFDMQAWTSVGGTGDPRNATRLEQSYRAVKLRQARGTAPWVCKS